MSVEGPRRASSQPTDWMDLVARIRADDEEAVLRLGEILQAGIRFFLQRALGRNKLESRRREVLALVIKGIRDSSIDDSNGLPYYVLTVLRRYTGPLMTACPYLPPEIESRRHSDRRLIRELLATITAADREALDRYYLSNETDEQICQALSITPARFRAIKNNIKMAVMSRHKESKLGSDLPGESHRTQSPLEVTDI